MKNYFIKIKTYVYSYNKRRKRVINKHGFNDSKSLINMICAAFCCFKMNVFRSKEKDNYPSKFGIVAIFKNEAPYLKEWIDYHLLIGVDKFYLYNNESQDDYLQILKPYIDRNVVELKDIKGKARQLDAYNDCLNEHKNDCQFLAAIDCDEFIFNKDGNAISLIRKFLCEHKKAGALVLNWSIFGSSGQKNKENGLVIERFNWRAENSFVKNNHVKSIVNPRRVAVFKNPHSALYLIGYKALNLSGEKVEGPFNENHANDAIRINHYFTKSREEYLAKAKRGMGDVPWLRDPADFEIHDKNDVFDDSMKTFAQKLKANEK